ncbi:MAG: pilin [Mogibacterium sp.]|nr:pilin [Mogibacterium sp.]
MRKRNQKGFTLAELLIVVAIIAVLVAISIPIFTSQLEKARQSTDLANLRSAYAEAAVKALDDDADVDDPDPVVMTHNDTGFTKFTDAKIGSVKVSEDPVLKSCTKDDSITVSVDGDAPKFSK